MQPGISQPHTLGHGEKRNINSVYHNETEFQNWKESFNKQKEREEKLVVRRRKFITE